MNPKPASAPLRNRSHRVVRQIHLWIGAWGALAAVIYGFSGLVMNHRFGDSAWPQGDSEELGREQLATPAEGGQRPEQLCRWRREGQGLDSQQIRKGPPGGGGGGRPGGDRPGGDAKPKWSFSGGTASEAWSVEYSPGADAGELKRNAHSPLAAVNRLHKGVGGGWTWILLADSFAIGMLLLGISGLWMWVRGRSLRDMVLSVFALSTLVLVAVLAPALA